MSLAPLRGVAAEKRIASFSRLAQRLTNDVAIAPTAERRRSAEEALDLLLRDIREAKGAR